MDFDKLFREYYPRLLFYAARLLGEAEAEDIVEDVFAELWRKRETVDAGDRIQAYLYRMVYTRAMNVLAHRGVEARYAEAAAELQERRIAFYEENNDIIGRMENAELHAEMVRAINRLPEKCREVFKLSYLHDLKNKEIADVMNISLRTVEAHMYKALKQLRADLKHFMPLFAWFFGYFFSIF